MGNELKAGMKYHVGMYGGAFNPMHNGHMECILKAASMCEKLFVVISYRNDASDIDVKVKYRWVYTLTSHIGNVKIILLEDRLKNKSEYTRKYWEEDSRKIKAAIGEKIDAVFFGSDYDKDGIWKECYPESEPVIFERDGCNSTAIRNDVYGNWDLLPLFVRPYYVKKVLIIGIESCGKSVLAINLAHHYHTNFLEEVGRDMSFLSGSPTMMLTEDYTRILLEHKAKEMRLIEFSNKVLIEDTDCLITRFFMDFLENESEDNLALAESIAKLNHYDLILLAEPDVEWVQDGDRSEKMAANRRHYSERVEKLYNRFGFRCEHISGTYAERYEKAIKLIDALFVPNDKK
ncbi:AAA family ATPase [Methanomicrobium mobile]|uniref:AAA family ATPase n=1 Tax=Methanomicrobium mobile TaxID=2205 RepID=UPI000A6B94B1|nr:AAA family ATPase [Methanomicrobium mobile]